MTRDEFSNALSGIRRQAMALAEAALGLPGLSAERRQRLIASLERMQSDTERSGGAMGGLLRGSDVIRRRGDA